MDFGNIEGNLPLIVTVIVLVLLQFFFLRKRKPQIMHREIVQSLLSEIRLNLSLVEIFRLHWRAKKFETVSWQMNKNKLDFLGQSLQVVLSDAFMMAEDFNQQIAAAKKHKSTSYMTNVNVDKLKEPLARSKEGLEEWLLAKEGMKEPPPKLPGILDDWLGRR